MTTEGIGFASRCLFYKGRSAKYGHPHISNWGLWFEYYVKRINMTHKTSIILPLLMLLVAFGAGAERKFVHPGLSYTQGQLDRMRAMVEAKVEPYYTTFQNLKNSEHASLTRTVTDRGTQIEEGKFNGTVGIDGRCAHDLALLWKLTGDRRYADKAVEYLNANNHYTNTSARGTGPLDNGKVNLLIEAAELMRDYDGWDPGEQQKFKDMLTYPYYSNTEDVSAKYADWSDDSQNGITFYWNIFNGDASRHGNQGMFGMLAMISMGVYLDNEMIYDRALRYVSGLPHREDDLPYVSGPPVTSASPTSTSDYIKTYTLNGRKSDTEDYGYDELLQYYFYPNGQCQESSRDQGHVLAGMHKYIEFAEIAWNQGDRLYSLLDNRLLKGIEFNLRYNLSFFKQYPDQPEPWEPSGYTTNWDEVTFDNGMYLQTRTRSGRWESVKPSPDGRGGISNVGSRESAYAHYTVRAGESDENTLWLRRAHDYVIEEYGYETSGTSPNWFYEWNGWGTLTKTLGTWMAGDPVRFVNGERVSGIHEMPGVISAADYDYYNISEDGEGHTYHKATPAQASDYRPDGGVSLVADDGKWVVADMADGEWMNYTLSCPVADNYDVYVTYRSSAPASLGVAVSGSETLYSELPASEAYTEYKIGGLSFPAGASVLRLSAKGSGQGLRIAQIRVEYNSAVEENVELTGSFDAKAKSFSLDWEFSGMLVSDVEVVRNVNGDETTAEVVSSGNTFGYYVDDSLGDDVPGYTYRLRYTTGGETRVSEPVSFEWGALSDWFRNEGESQWSIPGANGTGAYSGERFDLTCTADGAARLGRGWSFPFHAGNFPVLAFRMERAEGMTMALYSGSNSWNNGYDTFDGKIGDDVYYYDLTKGSFQNSKGAVKLTVAEDKVTSLPLQLRFAGPSEAQAGIYWAATFRSVEELKAAVADNDSPYSGVEGIVPEEPGQEAAGPIFNLTGVYCGNDMDKLPKGVYIRGGRKILVR